MKKRIWTLLLILALCLGCAARAEALPAAGEYALFAIENEGYFVQSAAMDVSSTLRLDAEGTGFLDMGGSGTEVAHWALEGGALTLTLTDGSSMDCALENGVLTMDLYGNGAMVLYYGHAQADLSAYHPLSLEEFLAQYMADSTPSSHLHEVWLGLDTAAGLHLRYDVRLEYMNSRQRYDVYGKGGAYYSLCATQVSGHEDTVITLFVDGAAYSLDPQERVAELVTTTSSSALQNNAMLLDDLYSAIRSNAQKTAFGQETREVDGAAYTVEVFPAETAYQSDAAFYFDEAGALRYYQEINSTLGESFYTLLTMDGAVDESLFSLTGYTVQ